MPFIWGKFFLFAHTDLQVMYAPKLAQSQSLGLQAKDRGYLLAFGLRQNDQLPEDRLSVRRMLCFILRRERVTFV